MESHPPFPTPHPWASAIAAYIPGTSVTRSGRAGIKLSANESPFGPSPQAIAAIHAAAAHVHRYPDGSSAMLREAIAQHHGLDSARIVCGTGSDELLHLIALAYATVGDEVIFSQYGFAVYPLAAQRVGATPIEVPAQNYGAVVDGFLAAVTPRTRVVYLANPNNPTGTLLSYGEIVRLHAGLRPDIVLVLDAAYAEYVTSPDYDCGLALARTAHNVVVTRTFSKIYGLGGLRVGWAYGPQAVIDILNKVRGPFNVSVEGSAGAIAALADQAWITKGREHNSQWRAWLAQALEGFAPHGVRAIPSQGNFILVECTGRHTAEAINTHLMQDGYLVRWLPHQGLGHCLRITIGSEADTRGVAHSLEQCFAQP